MKEGDAFGQVTSYRDRIFDGFSFSDKLVCNAQPPAASGGPGDGGVVWVCSVRSVARMYPPGTLITHAPAHCHRHWCSRVQVHGLPTEKK